MEWYFGCFKKYATFTGRASRKEYWMFVLFNIIFAFVSVGLDRILGTTLDGETVGVFNTLYSLAVLLPSLAVDVRRLHDIGKSGWYLFIELIPIVGTIWFIVLMATKGDTEANQFGENDVA